MSIQRTPKARQARALRWLALGLLTVASAAGMAQGGRRIALTVGIANYREPMGTIPGADLDAQQVSEALTELGWTNLSPPVTASLSDISYQEGLPTKKKILAEVKKAVETCRPQDIFLFSFSGHGMTYNKKAYLMPWDARIQDGRYVLESLISLEDDLMPLFKRLESERRIIFLNMCRSEFDSTNVMSGDEGFMKMLPQVFYGESSLKPFVLYSCRPGEVSYSGEKSGTQPTIFGEALISSLKSGGPTQMLLSLTEQVAAKVKGRLNAEKGFDHGPMTPGSINSDEHIGFALGTPSIFSGARSFDDIYETFKKAEFLGKKANIWEDTATYEKVRELGLKAEGESAAFFWGPETYENPEDFAHLKKFINDLLAALMQQGWEKSLSQKIYGTQAVTADRIRFLPNFRGGYSKFLLSPSTGPTRRLDDEDEDDTDLLKRREDRDSKFHSLFSQDTESAPLFYIEVRSGVSGEISLILKRFTRFNLKEESRAANLLPLANANTFDMLFEGLRGTTVLGVKAVSKPASFSPIMIKGVGMKAVGETLYFFFPTQNLASESSVEEVQKLVSSVLAALHRSGWKSALSNKTAGTQATVADSLTLKRVTQAQVNHDWSLSPINIRGQTVRLSDSKVVEYEGWYSMFSPDADSAPLYRIDFDGVVGGFQIAFSRYAKLE